MRNSPSFGIVKVFGNLTWKTWKTWKKGNWNLIVLIFMSLAWRFRLILKKLEQEVIQILFASEWNKHQYKILLLHGILRKT
jgi:hypothetical protein